MCSRIPLSWLAIRSYISASSRKYILDLVDSKIDSKIGEHMSDMCRQQSGNQRGLGSDPLSVMCLNSVMGIQNEGAKDSIGVQQLEHEITQE